MKIIATSIVLLAAAASAGETSLRLGRELKVPGRENGNNAGGKGKGVGTSAATDKGTGKGYGARCCADHSGEGIEDEDDCVNATCDMEDLNEELSFDFNGCEFDTLTFECSHKDDSGE